MACALGEGQPTQAMRDEFFPNTPVEAGEAAPLASVIVVSFRSADRIEGCLRSILEQELPGGFEVIVADNASDDGSADLVAACFPDVRLIRNSENAGFAAANNAAFAQAKGELIFLVNPDSELEPDALRNAATYLDAHPECGILGGLLLDDDGERAPSARRFPTLLRKVLMLSGIAERHAESKLLGGADYRWHDHRVPLEVDWVPGAFTALRRRVIEQIGFFDERFYLYYEETDLCRRARRFGWAVHFIPDAVVRHSGGASSRKVTRHAFDEAGSQVRPFRLRAECLYHRKNGGLLAVLGNTGFEWAWHHCRRIVNRFRRDEFAAAKCRYSATVVREIETALRDTSFGSVCPPKPW